MSKRDEDYPLLAQVKQDSKLRRGEHFARLAHISAVLVQLDDGHRCEVHPALAKLVTAQGDSTGC